MFSKELEEVIDAAIADGVLTDKERAVLHKRAQAEGVDPDELDVVIDGRLTKKKKEEDWLRPAPPKAAESTKVGNVMKCPNCGAPYQPGTGKCPECGIIIDAFNIDKEIITLIKTIHRADFTIKDGAIAGDWHYVIKSSFDNDPIMKEAYRIKGENYDGTQYEIHSNYVELMDQLRMLYSDNPKVKNFLAMQRNVEYNKIIAYGKDCIKKAKSCNERGGSWKNTALSWKNYAYGTINLLRQYDEMPNYAREIKEMEELYEEIKDIGKSTSSKFRLFGR